MTARIFKTIDFLAGTYFNKSFIMNQYSIEMNINIETQNIQEQTIAMQRINYFVFECLENSIMINETEEDVIEKYIDSGFNICTLPEEPYDQVVGIMLLLKLNAIVEGKIVVTDIHITSREGDVTTMFSIEENTGPFADRGWYNENNVLTTDYIPKNKNKKIVKLSKPKNDWADLYLDYNQEPLLSLGKTAEILFATFDKTEK